MTRKWIAGLAVVVICASMWGAISHYNSRYRTHSPIASANSHQQQLPATPPPKTLAEPSAKPEPPQTIPTEPAPVPNPDSVPGNLGTSNPPPPTPTPAPQPAQPRSRQNASPTPAAPQPIVPKPLARAALGFVGADPQAEEVWAWSINDPNRSPKERQDLIEDLNEEGFPDPKNITVDDVPLILSRLELIEDYAPDSMDDVNAAAFAEAYKDLVNMLIRLSRQ